MKCATGCIAGEVADACKVCPKGQCCPAGHEAHGGKCVAMSCDAENACTASQDCVGTKVACFAAPCPQFKCVEKEVKTCQNGEDTVEVNWEGKGILLSFSSSHVLLFRLHIAHLLALCPHSLPYIRTHWACARTHRSCWLRRHLPPPLPVSFIPVSADLRQRVWHQLVQLLLVHGEQRWNNRPRLHTDRMRRNRPRSRGEGLHMRRDMPDRDNVGRVPSRWKNVREQYTGPIMPMCWGVRPVRLQLLQLYQCTSNRSTSNRR
jgi:hypothetical protein